MIIPNTVVQKKFNFKQFITLREYDILPIVVEFSDKEIELYGKIMENLYISNYISLKYKRNLYLLNLHLLKEEIKYKKVQVDRIVLQDQNIVSINEIYSGDIDNGGFYLETSKIPSYVGIDELADEIMEITIKKEQKLFSKKIR